MRKSKIMEPCVFLTNGHCSCLTQAQCSKKCRFRQTHEEFEKRRTKALDRLTTLGLKPCVKKLKNGRPIMSTEEIKK